MLESSTDGRTLFPRLRSFSKRRLMACIAAIFVLITLSMMIGKHISQSAIVLRPYNRKELNRMCASNAGERIGEDEFEKFYVAGGKDAWITDESDAHWDGDEVSESSWSYRTTANMSDPLRVLKGPPTASFKDNLRSDLQYITGWYEAGLTNQFMGVSNLLFISLLSPTRIPIIPPFMARPHLPVRAGYKRVSEVYDLERWARSIKKQVVEWYDVKDVSGANGTKAIDGSIGADYQDELGCWSVWAAAKLPERRYHDVSMLRYHLNLDISYTPVPDRSRLYGHEDEGDVHVNFHSLAQLATGTSENPNPFTGEALLPPFKNPQHQNAFPPDTHLVCYDILYYVAMAHMYEWEQTYSPAWNLVGKYARWSDKVRSYARTSLAMTLGVRKRDVMEPVRGDMDWREDRDGRRYHPNDLFGLDERDKIGVKYIAIHSRHGDFLNGCAQRREKGLDCSPALSEFQTLVDEVEYELRQRGIVGQDDSRLPVIMTSDESSEEWWEQVQALGWKRVVFPEDLKIPDGVVVRDPKWEEDWGKEVYDKLWMRMLVEAAIQGYGIGFIGTQSSTMSLVAGRRTMDWQGGVFKMLKFTVWG